MNSYLLIMTLLFSSAVGGMGGVDHVKVSSVQECNRIGNAWLNGIKAKRHVGRGEAIITCVKLEEGE